MLVQCKGVSDSFFEYKHKDKQKQKHKQKNNKNVVLSL